MIAPTWEHQEEKYTRLKYRFHIQSMQKTKVPLFSTDKATNQAGLEISTHPLTQLSVKTSKYRS